MYSEEAEAEEASGMYEDFLQQQTGKTSFESYLLNIFLLSVVEFIFLQKIFSVYQDVEFLQSFTLLSTGIFFQTVTLMQQILEDHFTYQTRKFHQNAFKQ